MATRHAWRVSESEPRLKKGCLNPRTKFYDQDYRPVLTRQARMAEVVQDSLFAWNYLVRVGNGRKPTAASWAQKFIDTLAMRHLYMPADLDVLALYAEVRAQ